MSAPVFTSAHAEGVILALLRHGRRPPEDEIIRAVEAAQEAAETAAGNDSWDVLDVPLLLFRMVTARRIDWHDPPGGDGEGTLPLLYSLVQTEAAAGPVTP